MIKCLEVYIQLLYFHHHKYILFFWVNVIKYDVVLRKFTHFSGYLVGGVLLYFMYFYLNKLINNGLVYIKVYSVITGSLYAISDELHQYFVPGRSGEIKDVLLDSSGVITGVFLVWLLFKIIKKCNILCIQFINAH